MEAVDTLFLRTACGPGFTAIEKGVDDKKMTYFDLGLNSKFVVVLYSLSQHEKGLII